MVVNHRTSTFQVSISGVLQGSMDGQLLFNLFEKDLVLFIQHKYLGNYGDYNNLSITGCNIRFEKITACRI